MIVWAKIISVPVVISSSEEEFLLPQLRQLLSNNLQLVFSPPSKKLAQLFSLFPSVPFLFISTTINLAVACKKTFKLKASPGDIFQNNFYNFSLAEQYRSVFNCVARTTLSSCAKIKPKQKKCQNKTAKPHTKLFFCKVIFPW